MRAKLAPPVDEALEVLTITGRGETVLGGRYVEYFFAEGEVVLEEEAATDLLFRLPAYVCSSGVGDLEALIDRELVRGLSSMIELRGADGLVCRGLYVEFFVGVVDDVVATWQKMPHARRVALYALMGHFVDLREQVRMLAPEEPAPASKRARRQRYVYVVGDGTQGPVKIGVSASPEGRCADMRTANARDLRVLASLPGTQKLEAFLHDRYREFRVQGEWFAREPALDVLIGLMQRHRSEEALRRALGE